MRIIKVFSVDGSPLASQIASVMEEKYLNADKNGKVFGDLRIDDFSDGEMEPQFLSSIRGKIVCLVCSTNTPKNIMKLLLSIDAAKRSSAKEIIAVIPYYGYSRQDKKAGPRGPIGARLMADLLQTAGAKRIVSIDFHAEQIQGFFNIPVDHLHGTTVFLDHFKEWLNNGDINLAIGSPDVGGGTRAKAFYKKLESFSPSFFMCNKQRDKPNSIEKMELIGHVEEKDVVLIDDIGDTAGTICKAASCCKVGKAKSVRAIFTHAILSGDALKNIEESDLDEVWVADTVPDIPTHPKIKVIPIAPVFARALKAIIYKDSLELLNN